MTDWNLCEVPDCGSPAQHRSGRFCIKHLARFRRHGDPEFSLGEGRRDQHGHARQKSPTYQTWMSMRRRCSDPTNKSWKYYGARGVRVCDRWAEFANFLADMGERPDGKTLDRIDPDGDYEPSNCRWATPLEQRHNQRRTRRSV